jgi:hypothetical protein
MTHEILHIAERTIDYHCRMAGSWASKEALAELAENPDDVEKCQRQRASHLQAADTIRAMIKLLKKRQSNQTFTPPTIIDVVAFAKEHEDIKGRWPVGDIKAWWNHFQSNGWLVSGKTKMKDWKSAALNGFKNWAERNPGKANGKPNGSEPDGWRAYLKGIGRQYVEFKYAPDHLRVDFRNGSD